MPLDATLTRVVVAVCIAAALFSAGSLRWDPAGNEPADRIGVVTVGAGLHLTPFRQRLATIQLDLSLSVVRTPGIASRPFVSLSIAPWLGSGRQRNGGVQR